MIEDNDQTALLKLAEKTALSVGSLLKEAADELRRIDQELSHDVKIKADREAEQHIVEMLSAKTDFSILSEESGNIVKREGRLTWIIDPLDGTINFLRRIPISCVSIGLWDGDSPVLGVVLDFNRGEIFKGQVGLGAWLNGNSIHVSDVREKSKAILFTGFPAKADLSDDSLARFVTNVQEYRKVRWLGSAALSLAYVACGRGDAYEEQGIKFWDVAGALPIVVAAGGAYQMDIYLKNSYHVKATNKFI